MRDPEKKAKSTSGADEDMKNRRQLQKSKSYSEKDKADQSKCLIGLKVIERERCTRSNPNLTCISTWGIEEIRRVLANCIEP